MMATNINKELGEGTSTAYDDMSDRTSTSSDSEGLASEEENALDEEILGEATDSEDELPLAQLTW